MRNPKAAKTHWLLFACIGALVFGNTYRAPGFQQKEDEIRDITRASWKSKRAETQIARSARGKSVRAKETADQVTGSLYKVIKKMSGPSGIQRSAEDSEIGVTVWRLRPARSDDALEIRDLIQLPDGVKKQEWTPERVASDSEFSEGQMLRLLIESLRTGYLYVMNRAKYNDGTFGDPYLIFPTKRIYDGNNRVEAGRGIGIPGPDEEPLTLERGKSRVGELQASEELIILVTPDPLQDFPVAPSDRKRLPEQSVETLIKRYSVPYEVSEKIGGARRAITVAEKSAARTSDERLSSEDPYPQTIYRLASKPSEPMLIRVELKVRGK